jgi:hypothetical protein
VRELLRDAGYAVERWIYYDDRGYVYGYPSEVELGVVARDGRTFAVEITSALRRGDLQQIKRKVELFRLRNNAVYSRQKPRRGDRRSQRHGHHRSVA